MECPELVSDLTARYGIDGKRVGKSLNGEATVDTGHEVRISMRDGEVLVVDEKNGDVKRYRVRPVGASVQELWTCGGLEGFVLKSIQN